MNMLVDALHAAAANPYSWGVVGLIGATTLYSMYLLRTCPYLHRTRLISAEESESSLNRPFAAGPRFVVVMLAGIAAILIGLWMILREVNTQVALLIIVVGVFAVQVEPVLLNVQEAMKRVSAAQRQGSEAIAAAEDRLRDAYGWLLLTSLTILIAVVLALLAF